MLAQNFKTPADLGITNAEFDALAKVLGMLERGELPHDKFNYSGIVGDKFNMFGICAKRECGTVACILGWARIVGRDEDMFQNAVWGDITEQLPEVQRLFLIQDIPVLRMMDRLKRRIASVTDAEAAIALRGYLTTGDANWEEVLAAS